MLTTVLLYLLLAYVAAGLLLGGWFAAVITWERWLAQTGRKYAGGPNKDSPKYAMAAIIAMPIVNVTVVIYIYLRQRNVSKKRLRA